MLCWRIYSSIAIGLLLAGCVAPIDGADELSATQVVEQMVQRYAALDSYHGRGSAVSAPAMVFDASFAVDFDRAAGLRVDKIDVASGLPDLVLWTANYLLRLWESRPEVGRRVDHVSVVLQKLPDYRYALLPVALLTGSSGGFADPLLGLGDFAFDDHAMVDDVDCYAITAKSSGELEAWTVWSVVTLFIGKEDLLLRQVVEKSQMDRDAGLLRRANRRAGFNPNEKQFGRQLEYYRSLTLQRRPDWTTERAELERRYSFAPDIQVEIEPERLTFPLSQRMRGAYRYEGIGATLDAAPRGALFLEVFEGGPADLAGIREGDLIVSVDGEPATAAPLLSVSKELRGSSGTNVSVIVRRRGRTLAFNIERDWIEFPD